MSDADPHGLGNFLTTQWPLVERAGQGSGQLQRQALGELIARYMPALRAHLVIRKRIPPDRAEDLLHGFVADKVVEQAMISEARQERGRFRGFLCTSLDNYVVNQIRKEKAMKRAPGAALALDEEFDVADSADAPGDAFDIAWARELLAETIRRMKMQCDASGRNDVWGVFEARLLEPMLNHADPMPYEELVRRFSLASPAQAANVLVTARRMFVRVLRALVGEYESDPAKIDAEIEDLERIVSK